MPTEGREEEERTADEYAETCNEESKAAEAAAETRRREFRRRRVRVRVRAQRRWSGPEMASAEEQELPEEEQVGDAAPPSLEEGASLSRAMICFENTRNNQNRAASL